MYVYQLRTIQYFLTSLSDNSLIISAVCIDYEIMSMAANTEIDFSSLPSDIQVYFQHLNHSVEKPCYTNQVVMKARDHVSNLRYHS